MMNFGSDLVTIEDVEAIAETEGAILCDIDGDEIWIPKSQIDESSEVSDDQDVGTLVVSRWIAEKKGLA